MDPQPPPTDAALLLAWSEGDQVAGETLFDRHFDVVYRFVLTLSPSSSDAKDLVQQTFLACLQQRETLGDVAVFRRYLLGIARNQVRMRFRRKRVREREELVEDPQEHARATWNPRLSEVAGQREQQRLLLRALRQLPLEQQLPLELHYWDGLTTREIGELLDLKQSTVKKRLITARRRLAELMERLANDDDLATVSLRQFDQWVASMRARWGSPADVTSDDEPPKPPEPSD